jgi:butyryl-CoA dehydrogenase
MSHSPLIDRRHLDFVLHNLLGITQLTRYPRYAEHARDIFDATIDLAHRIAIEKFLPHNRKSDLNEPHLLDGSVQLIPEIGDAMRAYNEAGFTAIMADAGDGGLQLPFVVATACDALFAAANLGTSAYPALARAAANLLDAHACDDQKRRYMVPILEGRWFGTMCLSEPQAGSSLGDITTLATPQADGSYKIRGAKMWISAGEHELGANIVHLVLAKIVGAPPGVRGISLFIVPRHKVAMDGSIGAPNDVRLAGINHKMGQRGSVNTFLKFGEQDDCIGELVDASGPRLHVPHDERGAHRRRRRCRAAGQCGLSVCAELRARTQAGSSSRPERCERATGGHHRARRRAAHAAVAEVRGRGRTDVVSLCRAAGRSRP